MPAEGGRAASPPQQQEGFFCTSYPPAHHSAPAARIGSMLFKVMLFQTIMNLAASFFAPKSQQPAMPNLPGGPLPPLRNMMVPNSQFDVFMHLHYTANATDPTLASGRGAELAFGLETPPREQKSVGLLDAYFPHPSLLDLDSDAVRIWGHIPLKKLVHPEAYADEHCSEDAGEAHVQQESAEVAPQATASARKCTSSPALLPKPVEVWQLLSQNYTYNWFSSSQTKEVELVAEPQLLTSDALLLLLTVSVVPHYAYDGDRSAMRPEQVLEAAAALPDDRIIQRSASLIQKMKPLKKKENEHSLLLGGEQEKPEDNESSQEPIRHLKTQLDVSVIYDTSVHQPQTLSTGPLKQIRTRLEEGKYETMVHLSDFWLLEKHFVPLNDTLIDEPLKLQFSFGVGSVFSWLLQSQVTGVQQQQQQLGLQSDHEAFMFKRILLETNPFMLVFSALFIMAHSIFSFFAFKNDMQFWYKNESMEGLSAASLIFGFVCEVVIGLYLLDSEETSWLILFEVFLGVAISAWKLTKAIRFERQQQFPFVKASFTLSYSKSNTRDFDNVAITYASIALTPCVIGYAIYALLNNKYKSWYSYVISVLAGSVYTFGFVLMTPQLYINYKLKSVDHLPWRALIYRSLNTFVDDVASFLIDMPWMHRLSCFRDDIIFIVYLYQRWIYRVDKNRVGGPNGEVQEAGADKELTEKAISTALEDKPSPETTGSAGQDAAATSDKTSCETEPAAFAGATGADSCAESNADVVGLRRRANRQSS